MQLPRLDPNLQAGVAFLWGFVVPTSMFILFLRSHIDALTVTQLYWAVGGAFGVGLVGIFVAGLLRIGLARYWFGSLSFAAVGLDTYILLWLRAWWILAIFFAVVIFVMGYATHLALKREYNA